MNNEVYEENRPSLHIDQPPAWWIEQMRKEAEEEEEDKIRSNVIIVDMGTGEYPSEKDENGAIIIQM